MKQQNILGKQAL